MKIALMLVIILFIAGCDKVDPDPNKLEGKYFGIFHRKWKDTTQISLTFSDKSYQGQSEEQKYPAVGRGSFDQDKSTITFYDSTIWTADFDWSLILNGRYNYVRNGDGTIRIWKTNGNIEDEFLLRKGLSNKELGIGN